MADLIQIRRDTESNWLYYNPVLDLGEVGFVLASDVSLEDPISTPMTDPIQFKVGNGSSTWANLPLQRASSIDQIKYNGTTLYPVESGSLKVLSIISSVSGSSVTGNFVMSDAAGHLVDSGLNSNSFILSSALVQTTGSVQTNVMSQAATTTALNSKEDTINWLSTGSVESIWNEIFNA